MEIIFCPPLVVEAQPMLPKLNGLDYKIWPQPPYSLDLSSTDYHIFQHFDNFFQGKHFYNHEEAENAFQEFIKF